MEFKSHKIAVVYLARGFEERDVESYINFRNSYRACAAGVGHNLYILLKGIPHQERSKLDIVFADVHKIYIEVTDDGYDIGSYAHASRALQEDYVCFLNTHSEILADNWLALLFGHITRPSVGIVGCTGSYESLDYLGLDSKRFPNPHVRTNGFIVRRTDFTDLTDGLSIKNKFDAYAYESGNLSFSLRLMNRGLKALLVGRNGRAYPSDTWHVSGTFRQAEQENLLIADNQTRLYKDASYIDRLKLSRHAWGRFYNADECLDSSRDEPHGRPLRLTKIIHNLVRNPDVDPDWYLERYTDVAESGADAVEHYRNHGLHEGRFPNEDVEQLTRIADSVDASWYLARYQEVSQSTFDSIEHYLTYGRHEGRFPNASAEKLHHLTVAVDEDWYRRRYADVKDAGLTPGEHYIKYGQHEGRFPNEEAEKRHKSAATFDAAWYIARYPDVPRGSDEAAEHFLTYGYQEGRAPCSSAEPRENWIHEFDEEFYVARRPEAKSFDGGPLEHFLAIGVAKGYAPNPRLESRDSWRGVFDREWYLRAHEDVRVKGMDPLEHYITSGIKERRKPNKARQFQGRSLAGLELRCIKTGVLRDEVALYLVRAHNGKIGQYCFHFVEAMKRETISVVLVISGSYAIDGSNAALLNASDAVYVTETSARNFEGWAHLLRSQAALFDSRALYLTTDNYLGPINLSRFSEMILRVRRSSADIVALTDCIEGGWHLQPDFLTIRAAGLRSKAFQDYMLDIEWIDRADAHFNEYVAHFARDLKGKGLTTEVVFPSAGFIESDGFDSTVYRWRELLDAGLPFLNIKVARGTERGSDVRGWRERLSGEDFDPSSVDASLAVIFASEASKMSDFETSKDLLKLQARAHLHHFLADNRTIELPASNAPVLSIIIVVYNEAYFTLQCLLSVVEAACVPTEVIVVDNASSDDTNYLLARVRNANIIQNIVDLHFLRAANEAIALAKGRTILFLNNDVRLHRDAIRYGLETLESVEFCGAVGSKLILPDGTLQEAGSIIWKDGTCVGYGRGERPDGFEFNFRREVDYCSGAYFLISRCTLEQMSFFDSEYAPAYYEEADLCLRIRAAGKKIIYDPRVVVDHYEFASATSGNEPSKMMLQNFELFVLKNSRTLREQHLGPQTSRLVARCSSRGGARILMIDNLLPLRRYGAGFPRTRAMLKALIDEKFFVTYFPTHQGEIGDDEFRQERLIDVEYVIGANRPALTDFLEERREYYDCIIVCRPNNMEFIRAIYYKNSELFEGTSLIYDAEAVCAVREFTRHALSGTELDKSQADALIEEEVSLSDIAAATVVVNNVEADIFKASGRTSVHVLGHSAGVNESLRQFRDRKDFLFIGRLAEDNSPNVHSLRWFADEVLPHLERLVLDDFRIVIVGMNAAHSLKHLPGDRFAFAGPQEDLTSYYQNARVFIAPTQYAAGIPIKVIEAAAHGLPAVVTDLLSRQLNWPSESGLLSATQPQHFAKQCARLYQDEVLWRSVRVGALSIVTDRYNERDFRRSLASILSDVLSERTAQSRRCE